MWPVPEFLINSHTFSFHRSFQRIALVLLTLHYFSEFFSHAFQLVEIFDREDKMAKCKWLSFPLLTENSLIDPPGPLTVQFFNNVIFVMTRFATMVLAVLTLFYGINNTQGMVALFLVYAIQGNMIVSFIKEFFQKRRERQAEQKSKKGKSVKGEKKKLPKKESDLPEADQNPNKIKTK